MIRRELFQSLLWDKSFAHTVNILTAGSVTLAQMLNLALGRVGVARSWQLWPLERHLQEHLWETVSPAFLPPQFHRSCLAAQPISERTAFPDHIGSKNESLLEQQPSSRGEVPPISWSALPCFFELPTRFPSACFTLDLGNKGTAWSPLTPHFQPLFLLM